MLSNNVIFPEDEILETFDGEDVTEPINVIVKLRTKSSQPKMEIDGGVYWWIDPQHILQTLLFWKQKHHFCLRGISFPDILGRESTRAHDWSESQRKANEEKVARSWKNLKTKPYYLLAKYHKSFLEDQGITCEKDLGNLSFRWGELDW